ncbi:hypothetical protein B0O99DRAFT_613205 [Bisporella sp. PMI_857]|nr:hypothetical protein B0O99DRAFT_613205 [Bisporella sp. PMI_857]
MHYLQSFPCQANHVTFRHVLNLIYMITLPRTPRIGIHNDITLFQTDQLQVYLGRAQIKPCLYEELV